MLVLSRKPEESITITVDGVEIIVTVVRVDHGVTRLGVEAPASVRIRRSELQPKESDRGQED